MTAEIFCIGTEVLIGDIVNTNAAYIARRLSESGINVYFHSVCGDNNGRMKECLDLALSRSDLVITTGGLGPTYDDITKEMVAEKFGLPLILNEEILERLTGYFEKSGRVMTENNKKQAIWGILGTICGAIFLVLLVVPGTASSLYKESWICLIVWAILGVIFYLVKKDEYLSYEPEEK